MLAWKFSCHFKTAEFGGKELSGRGEGPILAPQPPPAWAKRAMGFRGGSRPGADPVPAAKARVAFPGIVDVADEGSRRWTLLWWGFVL